MPVTHRTAPLPRPLAAAGLPTRVKRTLEQALALVSTELDHGLSRLMPQFEQELFRMADQARHPGLESDYMATLRVLRAHGADLAPRFLLTLETTLARLRSANTPQVSTSAQAGSAATLSLIDDTVIDEEAALREIASRQEARANLSLHLLGQRFGVLAAAPAFDATRLPLGPQCLCHAVSVAAHAMELDHQARLLLYRIFDREVMSGYAQVLERLDRKLAEDGILPALTHVPVRPRGGPVDTRTPVASARTASTTGGTAGSPTTFAADPTRPYTGWGEPHTAPAAGTDPLAQAEAYARLRGLMSGRRELLRKFQPRGQISGAEHELETRQVSRALRELQQVADAAATAPRSLVEIKRSLLENANRASGQRTCLTAEDEDAFELLALLYSHIEQAIRTEAPSAPLVHDLQIPVLRAALQDNAFFTQQHHPARVLLNTVAESAASWHDDPSTDPRVQAALRAAVAYVVGNFDEDLAVFVEGNARVDAQMQAQARTAQMQERRHIEAACGREKMAASRARADELMQVVIGDRRLPRFSRSLLDQAWADVLTLTLLRHGEPSSQIQQQLDTTRRIVDVLLDPSAPEDPQLLANVAAALGEVGYQGEDATTVAQRLTRPRSDDDDAASRTELAMKLKARSRLGEEAGVRREKPRPRTPEEQLQYDYLRTLPFGTWMEFTTNQQGDVVRRRLSWYSQTSDHALFVNQRGQRAGAQSLDTVARLLASGNARVVTTERGHLVDRAWQAAIAALRSFAGRSDQVTPTVDA